MSSFPDNFSATKSSSEGSISIIVERRIKYKSCALMHEIWVQLPVVLADNLYQDY